MSKFLRPGYAIEYDFCGSRVNCDRHQETKRVSGLFFAGQINWQPPVMKKLRRKD